MRPIKPVPTIRLSDAAESRASSLRVLVSMARHQASENVYSIAADYERLCKLARSLDSLNLKQCNDPNWSERDEKRRDRLQDAVDAIAAGYAAMVHFGNDPRGPSVRLYWVGMLPNGCTNPDVYTDRMFYL